MEEVLLLLILWLLCAFIVMWIFQQKGRSRSTGFVLGFLLGIVGVIIAFFIPEIDNTIIISNKNTSEMSLRVVK